MTAEILVEAMKFAIEWTESLARHQQMEKIASQLEDVSSKLDAVQQQLGQLFLREIRAAYDSLDDARRSTNGDTARARIQFAEDSFLRNTRLDPAIMIGSFKSTTIMLMAHQGLATICALRHDDELARRHLLRLFILDPRMARTELNPSLFNALFRPKCEDIYEDYNRRDSERRSQRAQYDEHMSKNSLLRSPELAKIGRSGLTGALVAAALAAPEVVATVGVQLSDFFGPRLDEIRREAALDQRCREIASELLNIEP